MEILSTNTGVMQSKFASHFSNGAVTPSPANSLLLPTEEQQALDLVRLFAQNKTSFPGTHCFSTVRRQLSALEGMFGCLF